MTKASRSWDKNLGFVLGDSARERSSTGTEVKVDEVPSISHVSVMVAIAAMLRQLRIKSRVQSMGFTMHSVLDGLNMFSTMPSYFPAHLWLADDPENTAFLHLIQRRSVADVQ